jgi:hypothetical protein
LLNHSTYWSSADNRFDEDFKVVRRWRQAGDGETATEATESLEGFIPGGDRGVRATTTNEVQRSILEGAPGGRRGIVRAAVQDGGGGRSCHSGQESHEEESYNIKQNNIKALQRFCNNNKKNKGSKSEALI